tara:strand:- start:165919 stop:166176 length:258 start_codon:yes stop_codon:yes gene_type:complete
MGYHIRKIKPGQIGEQSKIVEEMEEFIDSLEQNNPLMGLIELSDMLGAVELYLEKHHPSITLDHLITMAKTTRRVFEDGTRESRG